MEVLSDRPDRRLLASLCAALPALRERAEAGLWSDELEELVADLAAGEPVAVVCRRLGLLADEEDDGRNAEPAPGHGPPGVEGAHLDGLAEVVLQGDYRCPRGRCSRRAHRDDRGRVPVCTLAEAPMTYRAGA
ncbi:hypothetical protein [Actinoplanes sp. GCM10030250]|uniref:hypothetical protein n=1 Tax=Actinoplanes sp. GCM10030250 TaxID=3273376 RepID=UPI003612C330